MNGVTTALVGFILVCVVFPSLVKNRPQFYGALAMVAGIILLDALSVAIGSAAFRAFAYLISALLQIAALLILFMAAGGLTPRQLAGDISHAYEVIRRGEEEKEVIIPRTGQQPKDKDTGDEVRPRIELNDPAASPAKKDEPDNKGIPLA